MKKTKEVGDKEEHVKRTLFIIPAKKEIANREEIERIISYPPDIIFLDKVLKTSKDEYVGEFLVTERACGGGMHKIGEKLVFRGVDLPEMAAQLLGVLWGAQHLDFVKDKVLVYRTIKGMYFEKPIFVNDLLKIKINSEDIGRIKMLGGPEKEKIIVPLSGKKFLFTVGKEKKATIEQIRLVIGSPKILGLVE